VVGPIARRAVVGWLIDAQKTSLRRACRLVALSTATWRYQRRGRVDNVALLERLQAHAAVRARYGYRRLHTLVAREGIVANHKRVHRVYREAGLQVRRRWRKRLTRADRVPLPAPSSRGERWSMDFMADTLADGRAFRTLNIVDDFSRECVAIEVDRSLPGARVVRVLEHLRLTIGLPKAIVLDNGPEFAGRALEAWAYANNVELRFIRPGKPIENAYVESFNGKFRDECLNEHWFVSLADAKAIIEVWRVDYNTVRPHGSLGQLTRRPTPQPPARTPSQGVGSARRLLWLRSTSAKTRRNSHYPCSGSGGQVRIPLVDAGHDRQHERSVFDAFAERTDMIERPGKRHHSAITHPAVSGFQSDDPAVRRWNSNRPRGVGSQRGNAQVECSRGG
jgi:putative transposase